MSLSDPIGDMIARIKNASLRNYKKVFGIMSQKKPISSPKNKKPGLGGRLTIMQKRFVEAYIKNGGNGTRAVIEAGYRVASESSAQVIASQYLKKPIIALALEKAGYEDCGIINVDEIELLF